MTPEDLKEQERKKQKAERKGGMKHESKEAQRPDTP
jgi:hypothetical protein